MTKPKYDGCTFAKDFNFTDCCDKHDDGYMNMVGKRSDVDRAFRECISSKGHPLIAWTYWAGVRVFGWWFWGKTRRK